MRKTVMVAPVLALACALVAAAGATTKPPAHKKPVFDKRFDCAAALPVSYLNSVYESFNWGAGVTLQGPPTNSMYVFPKGSVRGVSLCTYERSGAGIQGGSLAVVYGTTAAGAYKSDHATATSSGKAVCRTLIAGGRQPAPGQCGPVDVAGLGTAAYEYARYVAVLKGDVFVAFDAGGKYPPDGSTPTPAMLETVARYVLAHLP